jgi:hypothetical protein
MSITSLISKAIYRSYNSSSCIFDLLMEEIENYHEEPVHTISDLKRHTSTTLKGNMWEDLCVLVLIHVKGYDDAWRLQDVPEDICLKASLNTRDIGIDIIAQKGSSLFAIQCKYKKNRGLGYNPNGKSKGYKSKGSVSWRELSTFYALCSRTGPWIKHIVMTNCAGVNRMGTRDEKDLSICEKSFQNISPDQWRSMINMTGHRLTTVNAVAPSSEQVREARSKFLERFSQ